MQNENIFKKLKIGKNEEFLTDFGKKLFASVYSEKEEKIVYGKILKGEEGDIEQISIISETMLKEDNRFFSEKIIQNDEKYHPYFCEFIVDNSFEIGDKIKHVMKHSIGKWLKMRISSDEKNNRGSYEIHGTLIFSASPIKRKGCYLKFDFTNFGEPLLEMSFSEKMKKSELIRVLENYSQRNKNAIENRFKKITNELISIDGYVYNVGQGNCISIDLENTNGKKRIFFDIGESMLPRDCAEEPFYIEYNSKKFAEKEPSMIILSHWDMDHILRVHLLKDEYFKNSVQEENKIYWIAPNLRMLYAGKTSASAARLCAYLVKTNSILMFGDDTAGSLVLESNDKKVKLYQGAGGNSANGIRNNIGLILMIKFATQNNDKKDLEQKFLFSGDCEYSQMNYEIFQNNYDFIVTSHHGSKYAILNEEGTGYCLVNAQGHGRAIISYGVNDNGHPHIEHLNALTECGFKRYFTVGYQWINFKISNIKSLCIFNYPNKKEKEKIDKQLNN